jgi:hypothetical protein
MKYDDASWHYGGTYPKELPPEGGGTHIGMFVGWCLLSGLAGEIHTVEFPQELEALRDRNVTPGAFFLAACDEKFTDEDLSEEGNRFASAYYQGDPNPYLEDYERLVGSSLPSLYHVPDTWVTYEKLRPTLDYRLQTWRMGKLGSEIPPGVAHARRPWWRLW